jgi:hypothetical protein
MKAHFESKLILIQWLNEEDCIKSVYIKYITYSFSKALRPHVYDSWNITKQKKIKKHMHCPSIKSPFFYMVIFFKIINYYAFIVLKMQYIYIYNGISSKTL